MGALLRLTGITKENRFQVTARLIEAVEAAGGWIMGHQTFSNWGLCINFEIEPGKVSGFGKRLRSTGLELDEESLAALKAVSELGAEAGVIGTLQASFVHDEPEVKEYPPP